MKKNPLLNKPGRLVKSCILPVAYCLLSTVTLAQNDSLAVSLKYKVAIFAPLYLDSAFNAMDEYRYAKNVFPKFINAGLEFYEGAQLALDSLEKEGKQLEVFVYDTRSARESLDEQLNNAELQNVDLIIAHCASNEVRAFAETGLRKNIPVINAYVPNDGGNSNNPFFIVLNPTLRTQCEGIYKYIQRYYAIETIIVFRKKGASEDQVRSYFEEYGKSTMSVPLKIKYVDLTDSFTLNQLKTHLDTVHRTLCISGTLDANFGKRLAWQLASVKTQYPSIVMGMPTWDGIRDFAKPEYKGLE